MSCKSPSLEKVVQKSEKAKKQVDELNKQLSDLEASEKNSFKSKVDAHSKAAKINDFRQLIFSSGVKTEYSHEFSLDKITPVISSALKAAAQSLTGSALQVLTSPNAIESYSNLVISISEAAKSKSTASSSLNFSATRIAPGVYAFLSANSISIKDEETFGEEAVTATSVIYSLQNSIDDVKHTKDFEFAYLNAELLMKFKYIQIGYADELAKGQITIAVWNEKNLMIQDIIKSIEKELDAATFKNIFAMAADDQMPVNASLFSTTSSMEILEKSISTFENLGTLYKQPLENAKSILNESIFYL